MNCRPETRRPRPDSSAPSVLGRALSLALLLALLATACAQDPAPPTVARVNGVPVTLGEFRTQAAFMGLGDDPATLTPELRKSILESLIRRMLVVAEAGRLGIKLEPEELNREERLLRQGLSQEDLDAALAEQSLNPAKWRELLAAELLTKKTMDLVLASRTRVSAQEVKSYYLAHRSEFDRPAQVLAQHAVLPDKKTAQRLIKLLASGEEMGPAAAGLGFPLAEGGQPTWFSMGHMPRDLEKKIFSLKKGKVAGPFASDYGQHVIRVLDKKPAGKIPLDEAVDMIQKRLAAEKKLALAEDWLAKLRLAAKVSFDQNFIKTGQTGDQGG